MSSAEQKGRNTPEFMFSPMNLTETYASMKIGYKFLSFLAASSMSAAIGAEAWRHKSISLPALTADIRGVKGGNRDNAWKPLTDTVRTNGTVAVPVVRLNQGDFTVDIMPEHGSAIGRVRQSDGTDWFYWEGRNKDFFPFWESGIKASFPYNEHGTHTHQPSAWTVTTAADGSITYASWMEFSRHQGAIDRHQHGRYTMLLLEQLVQVRPDDMRLQLTYRVSNPTPYRQGLRAWNDCLWPRFHNERGVTQGTTPLQHPDKQPDNAQLLGPMRHVSDHHGHHLRLYDPVLEQPARPDGDHHSLFAWDMPAGWAGLWYPAAEVARLRIWDPAVAPGTKWYWRGTGQESAPQVTHNFIELWGGADHIFEGVERWIEPGGQWTATWTYVMLEGIGQPIAANQQAIITRDGDTIRAICFEPSEAVTLLADGQSLITGSSSQQHPLTAQATSGSVITLRRGGHDILSSAAPQADMDPVIQARIEASLSFAPDASERQGDQITRGREYRSAASKKHGYPLNSVERGRVLLRAGNITKARTTLEAALAATPDHSEGWHLLAVLRWDSGEIDAAHDALVKAVSSPQPVANAHYLLAISLLGRDQPDAAQQHLQQLLAQQTGHYEAQLLQTWLHKDIPAATALVQQAPADPRARWILLQTLQHHQRQPQHDHHRAIFEQLLAQEAGAKRRVAELEAACSGTWMHPYRMDTK
jgi:tetratricopeptide (TPR) repeat protein